MLDINPLSEMGLLLASNNALQRITEHLDIRVREYEAEQEEKEFLRYLCDPNIFYIT